MKSLRFITDVGLLMIDSKWEGFAPRGTKEGARENVKYVEL